MDGIFVDGVGGFGHFYLGLVIAGYHRFSCAVVGGSAVDAEAFLQGLEKFFGRQAGGKDLYKRGYRAAHARGVVDVPGQADLRAVGAGVPVFKIGLQHGQDAGLVQVVGGERQRFRGYLGHFPHCGRIGVAVLRPEPVQFRTGAQQRIGRAPGLRHAELRRPERREPGSLFSPDRQGRAQE